MAKFLQQLLGAKEPNFTTTIRQLESMTGSRSIDVTYIADIIHRAHSVMRRIGLDPADTTELELYKALNAHAKDVELFTHTGDVALQINGQTISFNKDDIEQNASLSFELRSVGYVQCQIQHELTNRFVNTGLITEPIVDDIMQHAGITVCKQGVYHVAKDSDDAHSNAPYILCVGDIFSDVFIKLLDDEARIDTDPDGSKRLSIPFGSKPPYERADIVTSVGPSPNAAVSCARLGLRVGTMAWLGDDQTGKDSLRYLASERIDTEPMAIQRNMLSNTYYVLRYGADRTILVKNENYDYKWQAPKTTPDWIYLSLISADSWRLHQDMLDYLDANPDIKFAFQPGTFHFKWGVKKLAKVYARAHIVVMNREEAVDVTGRSYDDLRDLAAGLHELGPKYVVITDGPDGSYASYDGKLIRVPNYPDPGPPVDRTGAGDAFASTIVAALALGEPMESALTWAPINSMNVVQNLGAQAGLLSQKMIKKYIAEAPDDYKAEEMK